jgi:hypothetical protein
VSIATEFCKRWSEMTRWMHKAPKCRHEFDYMNDMTGRDAGGNVHCPCHKCKEMFAADCGLNLPGTLIQRNRNEQR